MAENRVMAVGVVLQEDPDAKGYYQVDTWVRLSGSLNASHETYGKLTFLEACEVLQVHVDDNRPGWAIGDGWRQPPLGA
jgi:hypothetical protein